MDGDIWPVVLVGLGFVAGWFVARQEHRKEKRWAAASQPPRLDELDAATLHELKPTDREVARRVAEDTLAARDRLWGVMSRLNEEHQSYSSGVFYRETSKTPVEEALSGSVGYLMRAAELLTLPREADSP